MENQPNGDGIRPRAVPKQQGNCAAAPAAAENCYDAGKTRDRSWQLGPWHWVGVGIYICCIYLVAVRLDARLPTPLTAKAAGEHKFSEERARKHLNALAAMGPRPTGSDALEISARDYLLSEVEKIRKRMDEKHYRLDVDVHKPSGCFELMFLDNFTHCYKNLTNVVVRLGRRNEENRPASHSLLLNCHLDTVYQSAGASDDTISCAIMLELLNVFSRQDPKLVPYDLIFLFNGAEENFLQASHGFIATHPWRHTIRAFINLEGAGGGGREMLFQSGPANIWLLHAYLDSAPYPHCTIMAQEIFQSGYVPGDTDYRILRDFGHLPGMDIVYITNGYVYHTEFDLPRFVQAGAIQRGGENIFQTASAIIQSPCFTKPCPEQESRLVYFDAIGQFVVQYPATFGMFLNYTVVALIIYRIMRQIHLSSSADNPFEGYSSVQAVVTLCFHLATLLLMAGSAVLMVFLTNALNLTLVWYSWRPMVLVLYGLPTLATGLGFRALLGSYLLPRSPAIERLASFQLERVTFDMALLMFGFVLFGMTFCGLGSAYYVLVHASFPMLREELIFVYELIFGNQRKTATMLLITQGIALLPVVAVAAYGMVTVLEVFIPIMGRSGPVWNPEILISSIAATSAWIAVLYFGGFVYLSRGFLDVLKFAAYVFVFVVGIAAFTDFGAPYVFNFDAPRLRRLHIQHVSRKIYGFDGRLNSSENALHLASMDYRGVYDLPPTAFLQGSGPPPCLREDDYCGLPYYFPVKDMFPADLTLWMTIPTPPTVETPISAELTSTETLSADKVQMDFVIKGHNHVTVFVTPLNNWTLDSWSLTDMPLHRERTFFIYLSYVGRGNGPWHISLTLKNTRPSELDPTKVPKLLLGAASHYLFGPNQITPQSKALIDSIVERRNKPPNSLRYWKWAMTPDAFSSEYIAKYF